MKIACMVPFSHSEFRFKNIKDSVHLSNFNILSGYLKNNYYTVEIFDFLYDESANYESEAIKYKHYSPDIVIISAIFCLEDLDFYRQFEHINDKKTIVICCGVGVLDYRLALERMDFIDYIVPVNDEHIIYTLLHHLKHNLPIRAVEGVAYKEEGSIRFTSPDTCDLDAIFDVQKLEDYISKEDTSMAYIVASRGCWYKKCTFCTIGAASALYRRKSWFDRDIHRVIQEIQSLYKLNINKYHFLDTEFIGPGKHGQERTMEFARVIIASGIKIKFIIDSRVENVQYETFETLKKAGLVRVFLGIESGCQKTLDRLRKGQKIDEIKNALDILNELKLDYKIGSILAAPDSDLTDIKESLDFFTAQRLYKVMGVVGVGSIFHQLHLHGGTDDYIGYTSHIKMFGKAGSEIPTTYYNSEVQFFIDCAEQLQKRVIKRYHESTVGQKAEDESFRYIYRSYQNALRVLSFSILKSIIAFIESTSDFGNKEAQCDEMIEAELKKFDDYWERRISKFEKEVRL